VDGAEAARIGLVEYSVPADELSASVASIVARIIGVSASAVSEAKACIALAPSAEGFAAERRAIGRLVETDECRELLADFFQRRGGAKR
jgi:enoyl-CoA hydratase/carnithine racemase